MTVILDASGVAAESACRAAATLSLRRAQDLLLVGDEARITHTLASLHHNPEHLMVRHAAEEALPEASEEAALLALRLLARGHGAAFVSAGDPQRVLRAAEAQLELLPGIPRAALCAVFPTARRRGAAQDPYTLLLDVGASPDASPEHLAGYARMGAAYASRISRNPRPRVALLASRAGGVEAAEAAARLIREAPHLDYYGTISGVDIPQGTADVVVCSGLIGEVVVQLLEGIPVLVQQLTRAVEAQGLQKRLAVRLLEEDLEHVRDVTDWRYYGGAPLLGYAHPIILTQPAATPDDMINAVKLAAKALREDIVGAIRQGL